jgi:3-hydroxybutyryl-CoA dehydrogenase
MNIKIHILAIVGAGTMGSRIACRCVLAGLNTRLFDNDPAALIKAAGNIDDWLAAKIDTDGLAHKDVADARARLHACNTLENCVADADLIIETVPENLALKRRVFKEIDALARPDALMATNSSSLPCSRLADVTRRPQNIFNINFSDPLQGPLVEIMKGSRTADRTLSAGIQFIRALEMVPIVTRKEIMGFAFNRIWRAIKRESLHLVANGYATHDDIDRAWMLEFGTAIGPFGIMDEVGLDVVRDIETQYYLDSKNESDRPPKLLEDMIEQGKLGVKSDRGFYDYPDPDYQNSDWLLKKESWVKE